MANEIDAAVTELTKQINAFYKPREEALIAEASKHATKFLDAHPHLDRSEVVRRATDTWCDGGKSTDFVNAFYSL